MALLIKAAFSKIQGTLPMHDFFWFSDLEMHWPEYAWHITFYFAFAALAWSYYLQELRYKFEMLVFAILMSGELVDFMLRCNMTWFQVRTIWGNYAFSYDSFVFLIFGGVMIRRQCQESIKRFRSSP